MKEAGFQVSIKLPFLRHQTIKNPLHSPTMAKYLRSQWMKSPAIWSRGIVEVLEQAKEIFGDSNQLSEANFKNVKDNVKVHQYCSEPAEYVAHRDKSIRESNRFLMSQVKKLDKGVAAIDARRSLKKARNTPGLTQDELTQQKEEDTDEKWKRNGSPNEVESTLRIDLKACFETQKLKTHSACFQYFKNSALSSILLPCPALHSGNSCLDNALIISKRGNKNNWK
jgi:hypothetical protein